MVGLFVKFTNQYGAVLLGMCLICDESCYIYKSLWEQVLCIGQACITFTNLCGNMSYEYWRVHEGGGNVSY